MSSGASFTAPAVAANYGGFGSTYAEVVNPKDAVVNDQTINSDEVKAGKDGLQNILKTVSSIKEDLQKDSQTDVLKKLNGDLSVYKVRDVLNKVRKALSMQYIYPSSQLLKYRTAHLFVV